MPQRTRTLRIGESCTIEHRDPLTGKLTGQLTTITVDSISRRGEVKFSVEKSELPQVDLDIRENEANHAREVA